MFYSPRYLSTLYSHPEWPHVHPRVIRNTLLENINDNWMWLLITPSWMYRHLKIIQQKKQRGQPVSFTDFFGYLVGDTILKDVSHRSVTLFLACAQPIQPSCCFLGSSGSNLVRTQIFSIFMSEKRTGDVILGSKSYLSAIFITKSLAS